MKNKKNQSQNRMLETAHEMAQGLYDAGLIDVKTMREFAALCLSPVPVRKLSPKTEDRTMTTTLQSKLKKLPTACHKKINKRAKGLVAEEMTLRDLRKALELTQADLSEKLHMKQESISRLERKSDLLLSTLVSYIEAMGGELSITAKFPHRPLIKVTGLGDIGLINHH